MKPDDQASFLSMRLLTTATVLFITAANAALGQTASYSPVRMIKGKEVKAITGWKNQLGSVASTSGQHALVLTFKHMSGYDSNGNASADGTGGIGPIAPIENASSLSADPGTGGGTPPSEGGGTGTGIPLPPRSWVEIVSPLQFGSIPQGGTVTAVGQTRLRMALQQGDVFEVLYPSTGLLPAGQAAIRVELPIYVDYGGGQWAWTVVPKVCQEVTYSIQKRSLLEEASVTTRQGYGQPNREGQLKADINSDLRNFNYAAVSFRGGQFVGNVSSSTGDQSKNSRIQLWTGVQGSETAPRMAILSLLCLGSPSIAAQDQTVGLFLPRANDPNLSISPQAATWATRWDIVPRSAPTDPQNLDWSKDPLRTQVLSAAVANEYVSFQLTTVKDIWTPDLASPVGGAWNTTPVTPMDRIGHLVVAPHDEASWLAQGINSWKYFVSKEYAAQPGHTVFPLTDSLPRLWWITVQSTTSGEVP